MAKSHLKLVTPATVNRTVTPKRAPNADLRTREYLTEAEVERLMKAAAKNRWGHRDATMILTGYRHGLRVSELVDLHCGLLGSGGFPHCDLARPQTSMSRFSRAREGSGRASRRLEREAGRNVEVMWLTGRLAPDHKTIADFRKDNGRAIRQVCARFVALCRTLGLLTQTSVAIDGSKFKAVNDRDKNFTRAKMERRMAQIEESVARYLQQLDTADRQEPSEALKTKTSRLKEKIEKLKEQMRRLEKLRVQMLAAPDQQISLTDPECPLDGDQRSRFWCGWLQCPGCRRHRASSDCHT